MLFGDWRLNGQEEYLADKEMMRIVLPDFWEAARNEKNRFYQSVLKSAKRMVDNGHLSEEFLSEENLGDTWHEHCAFCWEKAIAYEKAEFYCTVDYYHWVCKSCFMDFKEKFGWKVKSVQ